MVRSRLPSPPHTEHNSSCSHHKPVSPIRPFPAKPKSSPRFLFVCSGAEAQCGSVRASGAGLRTRGPRGGDPIDLKMRRRD